MRIEENDSPLLARGTNVKEETYRENKDRGTKIATCTNDRGKLELGEDGENLGIEMMIR